MGCDIHLYVERLHKGRWVPVNPPGGASPRKADGSPDYSAEDYWDNWARWLEPESEVEQLANTGKEFEDITPSAGNAWAFGRDYRAFGQLAGVRGPGPIFLERRGLPDDISPQLIEVFYCDTEGRWREGKPIEYQGSTRWGDPDMHSNHWYDLLELRSALHERGSGVEGRIRQLKVEMEKIAAAYQIGPLDVRTVFGFDN